MGARAQRRHTYLAFGQWVPEAAAVAAQRLAVLLPEAARVRHVVFEHGDGLPVDPWLAPFLHTS
eukprot:COSAG04_NODE_1117_length_8197_cov_19.090258_5_plen_64_part_00